METPYRVLIVEDVPTDAELNERAVQEVLTPCIFERVETEADFLKALDEFKPDIILSDYSMPVFNGLTALKLTLARTPITPFILVTGSLNEDTAVNCMKAGAANYIIKQHLKRLGPAVLHALEEKRIRLEKLGIQEELKKSELRYSTIVNSSPNIIFIHRDGIILYVNDVSSQYLGYSRDEIIGKSFFKFIADDSKEVVLKNMRRRMAGEDVATYEVKIITKFNDTKYFFLNAAVIPYEAEKAFLVILSDITERKKAEEALTDEANRRRILMEQSGDGIVILDQDGKVYEANRQFAAMLGYSPEEVRHLHVWDWDYQWSPEQLIEMIRLVDASGDHFETRHRRKDGSIYDVEISTNGALLSGQKLVFCVCRDISGRKAAENALRKSEEHLRVLMGNLPGMAYRCLNAANWPMEFVSEGCSELTGYESEELMGKNAIPFEDIIHPEDREEIYDKVQEYVSAGQKFQIEYRIITKQGDEKHVWEQGQLVSGSGDERQRLEGIIMDITKRKQAEDELRSEKTFTENALNSLSDVFFVFDLNGKFLRWNKNMNAVLGYSDAEISSMQLVDFFSKEDVRRVLEAIEIALRSGYAGVEARVITKGGRNIPYEFSGTLLKNHEGKPAGICGIGRDITERKKTEERIEYLAYYDALTGLPNRNLFLDRVSQAIARAGPTSRIVAVLITNIDRFKSINDTYGSEIGDRVLKEISGRLSTSVRKGDTIARLSNDEFGIALLDVAHPDDIVMVLEKIIKDISYPLNIAGDEIILTFSTGVSLYPNDGEDTSELLKSAGLALSIAKKEGGKTCQFYSKEMNVEAVERMLLEKQLVKAIKDKEFILHYQPYWDITTKKMVGMEALVRWQSRDKGLVPPGKFIPVLEDTGMIIEVGEWILKEAMRQVKEWQNNGHPVVPVSVNMSLVQFRQKDLAGMIKKIMKDRGYYPSLLTLEITESAFMQDIEFTKSVLTAMKETGCSISIDDFGTGYSSLSYLKRFPIDNLKIDISFIREMVRDPDSASIVMAIINMAHTLNLKTIAEGIETEEQWNFLRLLRCDMGQGFYLSKPLPAEDLEKLFISNV